MRLPIEGLREKHKREKRARLRMAAATLFETEGYPATTTRSIAAHAGVAHGTLFRYAEDKTDLLFLVFHDELEEASDEAFAYLEDSFGDRILENTEERVMHVFARVVKVYAAHPRTAAEFIGALPSARGRNAIAMNSLTAYFIVRLASLLERGKELGDIAPEVECLTAAQNLFALYFYALMTWISGVNTLENAVEVTLRHSIALQFSGIRRREP